jgi:hypothetical protein
MTVKIHHATIKRAARLGLTFVEGTKGEEAGMLTLVSANGRTVAIDRLTHAKQMLDDLVAKYDALSHNEDEDEDTGDDDFEGEGQDDAEGDVDEEQVEGDDEGDDDEDSGKSIVKSKYKTAYRPFKQTCGDDMARAISVAIKVVVTVTLPSGKQKKVMRIDPARLKKLAKMNGVWDERYASLNIGQARMNCGNRLRKLAKDGVEIKGI